MSSDPPGRSDSSDGDDGPERGGRSGGRTGDMTLVFTLAAIGTFAEPATVFEEARAWSRYVGIVAKDTDAVDSFVDAHGVRPDFDQGEADKWLAVEEIGNATATPRHVLVGASMEDRRIADHLGWEFRRPEDVAEKADWELANDDTVSDGVVSRLLGRLFGE
jgi:hypothetical protein